METIAKSLAKITEIISKQNSAKLKVKEEVSGQITKSISLWNSMIIGLGERTDINISTLQPEMSRS